MSERGSRLTRMIDDLIHSGQVLEIPVTESPRTIAELLDIPEGGTVCIDCGKIYTHYWAGSNEWWKQHRCESSAANTISGDLKIKLDLG